MGIAPSVAMAYSAATNSSVAVTNNPLPIVDKSLLDKGIIAVNYGKKKDVKTIVRITKDKVSYDYDLIQGMKYPLQLGNGQYTIWIAELVGGTQYKVVAKDIVNVQLKNNTDVFLQSIELIDWEDAPDIAAKAKALVKKAKTDKEKVTAIYSYIIKNIRYDYNKAKTIKTGYIPDLDVILKDSKGICYDYAATFAAMLRSQGIPTKMVMGYQTDDLKTYHAWNEVFLKASNEWITIDTTYDAIRVQGGQATKMIQKKENYKTSKIY